MNIISKLPSTYRYRWRRKNPDYIDVSEVKPNPITAWIKSEWKRIVATEILRISRCICDTNPGIYFISVLAAFASLISKMMDMYREPTMFQAVWGTLGRAAWMIPLFLCGMYGCWEIFQGCNWIKEWAKRHTEHGYRDDN